MKSEAKNLVKAIREKACELAGALRVLRDRKGWQALGYESWAACCEGEFGYSKSQANRLIAADKVKDNVTQICATQAPGRGIPGSHASELARLPEDQQSAVYAEAVAQHGDQLTAAKLREAVEAKLHPEPAEPEVVTCPNCGNTTFDEYGDCAKCHEPEVVSQASESSRRSPCCRPAQARRSSSRRWPTPLACPTWKWAALGGDGSS